MTHFRPAKALCLLAAAGLVAGGAAIAAGPASAAAVTCPAVSSSGAVSPAPTPGVDWAGCDLDGAYLPDMDMASADLQGANLTSADAAGSDMAGANLSDATLTDAELSADLSGADLASAYAEDTSFTGANLKSANLDNAYAWGASFVGAAMQGAQLVDADLDSADLGSADLFGATLTGVTDSDTSWLNTICPNGASANYYTDGCLSSVAVTTPSATPTITGGTLGNNGWYTSPVTVTWYWVDSNSLGPASGCPSSTTSAQQGSAVVITASCTDSAGNTGTGSLTTKIDTTPPVVTLSGVRSGATYLLGLAPTAECTTTDAVSGVAAYAYEETLSSRPDGSGINTAECAGAEDEAGNKAPTVKVRFLVVYTFGGFISPKPGTALNPSAHKIVAKFRLANGAGKTIPASTMRALAATYDVRVTLRGPDTKPVTSSCSWDASGKYLECVITRPVHIRTGRSHKYTITATENLGTGSVTAPADAYSQNPEPVYFR